MLVAHYLCGNCKRRVNDRGMEGGRFQKKVKCPRCGGDMQFVETRKLVEKPAATPKDKDVKATRS